MVVLVTRWLCLQSIFTLFKLYDQRVYGERVILADLDVVASGSEYDAAVGVGCAGTPVACY